jgi:predicted MFS family arabinose efflux permease
VYALLFADTGLSPAETSSLFVLWSVTAFALEVPSGLWADLFSRRRLLALAPLLGGAGFVLWTFLPCYASFAVGFVLWGAGSALRSGALQALVYEELERTGRSGDYARLIGRSEAASSLGVLIATALAAPVLAVGGWRLLGVASAATTVVAALVARTLPESRAPAENGEDGADGEDDESFRDVLRSALSEVRSEPPVLRALLLVSAVTGLAALDEYIPLFAEQLVSSASAVPLLVLVAGAGELAGGWLAGRGVLRLPVVLATGAACLVVAGLCGGPAGMVPVAVAFGVFRWASAATDARLQDRISDRSRATVTSLAGVGSEVGAVLTFGGYALGSVWLGPGALFALAALPLLLIAVLVRR